MVEQLNQWGPLLTILVSLGGLIITAAGLQVALYLGLRADLRYLAGALVDVRERLSGLEVRVGQLEARLPTDN